MEATATVVHDLAAVKLTATGAVGAVTWVRRIGGRDTTIGTGATVWDRYIPLNTTCAYIATDDTDAATAGPVAVQAERPVLADTVGLSARPVTVLASEPREFRTRSVWHAVLGRTDPVVTVHPVLYPSGVLHLLAPDARTRDALLSMTGNGYPLLLRSTCEDRVRSMTFVAVDGVRSEPFGRDRHGPPYRVEVPYQQVEDNPYQPANPSRTYADVLAEGATYADILGLYPTYRALLDGPAA